MNKTMLILGLTAALAACTGEDHNIVADSTPKDDFNAAAEVGNVVLPPAIQASKTYRCADNTIVNVDWLADGKSATIRVQGGATSAVSTAEAGQPMTGADGSTLAGTATASSVKIGLAGKPAQTCNG